VTWDCPKRENMGKKEDIIKNTIFRRIRGVIGTCKKTTNFVLDIP
jgi:hypothetical protein